MINILQIENCLRYGQLVFDPPLSEPICEIIMSISQTIFNLQYIYHAMLTLRAFLVPKGISCCSGVKVAHTPEARGLWFKSQLWPPVFVFCVFVCLLSWITLSPMGKKKTTKKTVVFDLAHSFCPDDK